MEIDIEDLPERWQIKRLRDCVQDKEMCNPKKAPLTPFIYVDISSIDNNFQIVGSKKLLGKEAPSRAKKIIRTDDVIFATTRPNLKHIAIVSKTLNNQICSTGFCVLRAIESLNPRFLFYYLTSDFFQKKIEPLIHGTSYPAITDNELLSIQFPFPPIEIQQKIVAKLDAFFEQYNELKRLHEIEKAKVGKIMQAAISKLIPDPQGELSVEWKVVKFSDSTFFKTGAGGTPLRANPSYYAGNIPWIKSGELRENEIFDSEEKISQLGLENSSAKYFDVDTILLAMYGANVGRSAILKKKATTNQAICGITCNREKVLPYFVWYYLMLKKEELIKNSFGGAQPNISQQIIKEINITIPSIKTQEEIISKLEQIRSFLRFANGELERKEHFLELLPQAVLRKAFRGELI